MAAFEGVTRFLYDRLPPFVTQSYNVHDLLIDIPTIRNTLARLNVPILQYKWPIDSPLLHTGS